MLSTLLIDELSRGKGGQPLPRRHSSQKAMRAFVDLPDGEAVEMNSADPFVGRLDSNGVTAEWLGYKDRMVVPLDRAAESDFASFEVGRVARLQPTLRKRTR